MATYLETDLVFMGIMFQGISTMPFYLTGLITKDIWIPSKMMTAVNFLWYVHLMNRTGFPKKMVVIGT